MQSGWHFVIARETRGNDSAPRMTEKHRNDLKLGSIAAGALILGSLLGSLVTGGFMVWTQKIQVQGSQNAQAEQARWELKRNAAIKALTIADSIMSARLSNGKEARPSTRELRAVYNELALSSENPEVIRTYMELMVSPVVPTSKIQDFVNTLRKDLHFKEDLNLDTNASWIGTIVQSGTNAPEVRPY